MTDTGHLGAALDVAETDCLSVGLWAARSKRNCSYGEKPMAKTVSSRAEPNSQARSTVLVIDDDAELRSSVERLLRSVGLNAQLFASIPDFLKSDLPETPTCLVLDVRLPGKSGLDFQRELATANIRLPIIFITGHGDIPMTVQAMKEGAIEFLTKPFREQALLDAIQLGLEKDRFRRKEEAALGDLRDRLETLSVREREVMVHVVRGRLSKQIAGELGISETTVKVHRSNLMRKMKARSLSELTRMADKLELVQDG